MSQRLALIQLHYLLLADHEQEVLWDAVERLGLHRTLPSSPSGPAPPGSPNQEQLVRGALGDLVKSFDEPELASGSDAVPPIEVLHLLIRLSSKANLLGFLQANDPSIGTLAGRLFPEPLGQEPDRVRDVLEAIDGLEERRGVLRVRGLDEQLRLEEQAGPSGPTAEPDRIDTVGSLLDPGRVLGLLNAVWSHPIVDVEARLYKAIVNGQAEYPVHLRTTIRFENPTQDMLDRFPDILEPLRWPGFHSFWRKMTDVEVEKAAPPADAFAREQSELALERSAALDKHINTSFDSWERVGTYREEVGFDPGQNLFPQTILYFAKCQFGRHDGFDRTLLSYNLVSNPERLEVDDGCIELALSPSRADVITTKSLYVNGTGNGTEVGGTLAYFAANSGWGTQTLALVANAVLK